MEPASTQHSVPSTSIKPLIIHGVFAPKNSRGRDEVALPIPSLQVLNEIVAKAKANDDFLQELNLQKTLLVMVQHVLTTTVSFVEAIKDLGFESNHIFLTGKCYSTSDEVEKNIKKTGVHFVENRLPISPGEYADAVKQQISQLWKDVDQFLKTDGRDVKNIIILDDGGRCLEAVPNVMKLKYNLVGIEQTRGGLYNHVIKNLPFPLIGVAYSAVKKLIEPEFIAETVIKAVDTSVSSLRPSPGVFGVVGAGAIGRAIINHLLSQDKFVWYFDEDSFQVVNVADGQFLVRAENLAQILSNTDCVLGCTGKDITDNFDDLLSLITADKTFISCSSEDKEFNSLLRTLVQRKKGEKSSHINVLGMLEYEINTNTWARFANGGFPINFNRSPIATPEQDIALTLGLLLGAIIQAAHIAGNVTVVGDGKTFNVHREHPLDAGLQREVLSCWISGAGGRGKILSPSTQSLVPRFQRTDWVIENSLSDGTTQPTKVTPLKCFNTRSSTPENTWSSTSSRP